MRINGKDYDLNKQAKEITQDVIGSENQVFSTIFTALDSADGEINKKLNKKDLVNIFKAMVDVDNQSGKGDKILSENEIKILKEKLLPNSKVSILDFKNFIIKLLNVNEHNYINVSLGPMKNGVRQVGPDNIAIRESRHNKLPAKNNRTSGANERIDAFSQGRRGDCYLLAEINAIKNASGGQKIFKDNIVRYKDGSAKVTLPGAFKIRQNLVKRYPDKTNAIQITGQYKISAQAIERASRLAGDTYSEGDLDVIMYEIAFESYRLELSKTCQNLKIKIDDPRRITAEGNMAPNPTDVLSSGTSYDAGFLITGETSDVYEAGKLKYNNVKLYKHGEFGFISREEMEARSSTNSKRTVEIHNLSTTETSLLYKLYKYSDKEKEYALTFSVRVAKDGPDGSTKAGGGHALTILKITKDTVYVLNPWDKDAKGKECIEPIPILDFIKMCKGFVAHKVDNKPQVQNESTTQQIQNILNTLKKDGR